MISGIKSISGADVLLKDGRVCEKIDTIVFATGYDYDFSFLDASCGIRLTAEGARAAHSAERAGRSSISSERCGNYNTSEITYAEQSVIGSWRKQAWLLKKSVCGSPDDAKCIPILRTTFIEHPRALFFPQESGKRLFQQPQAISHVIKDRRRHD